MDKERTRGSGRGDVSLRAQLPPNLAMDSVSISKYLSTRRVT